MVNPPPLVAGVCLLALAAWQLRHSLSMQQSARSSSSQSSHSAVMRLICFLSSLCRASLASYTRCSCPLKGVSSGCGWWGREGRAEVAE